MEWVSNPCLESKRRTILLLLFLAALFAALYIWFEIWGFIIGLLLVGSSVYPYFASTKYEMSDEHIVIKGLFMTRKKSWKEFKSFYPDRNGVLLSPFPRPTRLENFRGTYLRFGKKRHEISEYIRERLEKSEDRLTSPIDSL